MQRSVNKARSIPATDRVLKTPAVAALIALHGRSAVTEAVRAELAALRRDANDADVSEDGIAARVGARVTAMLAPSLKPVFNLTGTVLHTNLGRAPLPDEAIEEVASIARTASTLEYDVAKGARGERDDHVEAWLCRLTGAEAATVVNNNAAAVMLVLNTLAARKEVAVSRGELVEIGGAFRLPEIMARAGCKLHEVGTTNRTHLRDYGDAVGPRLAAILRAHPSNYEIRGFTARVPEEKLAALARKTGIPFIVDLGSGSLVDLARWGLPHEPTVRETLAQGADVVTFSGDKLLGGPQAGLIVGNKDLIARIRRNPMKRALRCDKLTLAALGAVLRLYADPDRLAERLPTLRLLARPAADIAVVAARIAPLLAARLPDCTVAAVACESEIGSGALPTRTIASHGVAIRARGARLGALSQAFRALPVPVIGRIQDGALIFDLRCLDDEARFVAQLAELAA